MTFLQGFARKLGVLEYLGTWNASTGNPPAIARRGGYYVVTVAGDTTLDGISDWNPGDWAIFNGGAWEQIDNSDEVGGIGLIDGGTPQAQFDGPFSIDGGGA